MAKKIELTVAEAVQDDVSKGIVRIDSNFMREVDVRPGDIVEISGQRSTVAIVDRAYPGDIGLNIIRMDGLVRRNSKSSIGELVAVKKAEVKEAKEITIAPARSGIVIRGSPNVFKQGLLGRAVLKGDVVSLGGTRSRRTAMSSSPFFDDVFSMLDENLMTLGFGDLKFVVVSTNPVKEPVIITDNTKVIFNPDAKEVKEEMVLEVSYEDIGGLSEEIKKIREMVELPLKHPEVFERLGVEPPKGVLLHGPPGTGKTLLAKAVANETKSHFILINGPEIMSKFYGQSLPGEEKLLIQDGKGVRRVPIEDIVHEKIRGRVACFDKKGNVNWSEIKGYHRHKRASPLVNIKTRSGRSIKVTQDHSLFTLTKKGIESVPTSQLTVGKSFVAVPKNVPGPNFPVGAINLLQLFEKSEGVYVRNCEEHLRKAFKKIGRKKAAALLNISIKYSYDIISKKVGIPVKKFLYLMDAANIQPDLTKISLATKGKRTRPLLVLTPDLCHFFGWWMAEGSYTTNNEARLSVHSREVDGLLKLCTKLFRKVTIYRKNDNSADIYICAGILGKIMKALGFTGTGRTKKVPQFVYNLDKELLAAFLSGYISGDGSVHKKHGQIEISTESPELADDVCYLLLRFGIVARVYDRKGRPQKRVCFASKTNLEKFLDIGFVDEQKNKVVRDVIASKKQVCRRDKILVEALQSVGSAWKDLSSIGVQALQKLQGISAELQPAIEGDIYWDKLAEISVCEEQPEYVYDISVEPCQNFISGFGGIFAHNSEENIRNKFEEAEKNAPSIIFIDEIDAIAAKREETRGEVEKRVVAQMLALMDGLKSRGRVVVIAATNVPNILDPALRRPGRFDRELEIGVPRYEGRLNILKIHTRNMPLQGEFHDDNAAIEIYESVERALNEANRSQAGAKKEIKKLEAKKEGAETSFIQRIKNSIQGIEHQLEEQKNKELKLKEIKMNLQTYKDGLHILIDEIKNIKDNSSIWDVEDPRSELIKRLTSKSMSTLEPNYLKLIRGLVDLGIVGSGLYQRVLRRDVENDLQKLARKTHGFVGADLASLAKESAMVVLRRVLPDIKYDEDEEIPTEVLEKLKIMKEDFREALKYVRPSAMREILVEIPNVKWDSVGGLEDVKQELKEAVEWPLNHPEAFKRLGVNPPKGILLYGPPGTGKTLLAKAIATESESNFILVNGPSLLSKWVGESEKAVRKIFEKARQISPAIIFFDEMDSLAPRRGMTADSSVTERVVNQLLSEIDGVQGLHDIVIIGATNRPDIIDTALLRPGRFDRIILAPVPDENTRRHIYDVHLKGMPVADEVNATALAVKSEGYVGADIESVCREAAIFSLRRDMKSEKVELRDFEDALLKVKPSVTKEIEEAYKNLQDKFKQARGKEMGDDKPSYFG